MGGEVRETVSSRSKRALWTVGTCSGCVSSASETHWNILSRGVYIFFFFFKMTDFCVAQSKDEVRRPRSWTIVTWTRMVALEVMRICPSLDSFK